MVQRHQVLIRCLVCVLCAVGLLAVAGCNSEPKKVSAAPPPATFSGPDHLHGTVSSLVTFRKNRPILVSGYGLVVGLNNTGSGDVPDAMRPKLIQYMSGREGMNMAQFRKFWCNELEQPNASESCLVNIVTQMI